MSAVDGGMADNARPSMYQAQYRAEVANKKTIVVYKTLQLPAGFAKAAIF